MKRLINFLSFTLFIFLFSNITALALEECKYYDKDNNELESNSILKTGDLFKVTFPEQDTIIYKLSISGDVNGDGKVDNEDVKLTAKHLIKGNLIIGAEYLKAANIDNTNEIDLNDIIKMTRRVKDSGDTNE